MVQRAGLAWAQTVANSGNRQTTAVRGAYLYGRFGSVAAFQIALGVDIKSKIQSCFSPSRAVLCVEKRDLKTFIHHQVRHNI